MRLLDGVRPLGSEAVRADEASGRYLAEPVISRRTQPSADLSAMDGYAVREDDLVGPWRMIGESSAGHPFSGTLQAGEAVRISTGALMPNVGGAVLLQENATRDGNRLSLNGEGEPELRHIRRRGFDFGEGDQLLKAGALLNPARIALALSAGHGELAVGKRPRIAVLDNGDELAADPAQCAPHQIPASNGAMLAAMARPLCSKVDRIGPVPDSMNAMLAALERTHNADVVVTSGGASVGDHDLVRPALKKWGAQIDFWRIAMKPGKPLMVAQRGKQVVLGLPGNPVSSYVTAFLFLLPLLRKLAGAALPVPQSLSFPLAGPMRATGSRAEFVRGSIRPDGVAPLGQEDSSALASLSAADCLILRPVNAPTAAEGETVRAYPLHNGGMA